MASLAAIIVPGPGGEGVARDLGGHHVDAVRRRHPAAGGVEDALVDHQAGAVPALLARLEHEDHVAGELLAVRAQHPGGADEHRGVQVVAAGVHDAVDAAAELQAGLLLHRQRVHVAAQQHRRSVAVARPPRSTAVTDDRPLPVVTSSGSPSRARSTRSWVSGRSRPTSGVWCSRRRRSTTSSWTARASSRSRSCSVMGFLSRSGDGCPRRSHSSSYLGRYGTNPATSLRS